MGLNLLTIDGKLLVAALLLPLFIFMAFSRFDLG
jgi:hypothetical protein